MAHRRNRSRVVKSPCVQCFARRDDSLAARGEAIAAQVQATRGEGVGSQDRRRTRPVWRYPSAHRKPSRVLCQRTAQSGSRASHLPIGSTRGEWAGHHLPSILPVPSACTGPSSTEGRSFVAHLSPFLRNLLPRGRHLLGESACTRVLREAGLFSGCPDFMGIDSLPTARPDARTQKGPYCCVPCWQAKGLSPPRSA